VIRGEVCLFFLGFSFTAFLRLVDILLFVCCLVLGSFSGMDDVCNSFTSFLDPPMVAWLV
jgi:hypothetical protein